MKGLTAAIGTLDHEIADASPCKVCRHDASTIFPTDGALAVFGHALLPATFAEQVTAALMYHCSPGDQQANGTLEFLHI